MTHRGSILIADDEEKIVRALARALREDGHDVVETTSARHAQHLLTERSFDLAVVDNIMPEMTGLDLIRGLAKTMPEAERPPILLMTGQPSIEGAVEALKLGALDYLQKPFEIEDLLAKAARVLESRALRSTSPHRAPLPSRGTDAALHGMVGESAAIRDVLVRARLVASTKSTILITGETGTGKELVARAIHAFSAERARPLVKVNCAAIPDNLLESELFGYVRGAFTGALTNKRGKFALADGGTIFLDEIGCMNLCLQPKILRVLQEREYEPVGAERTERVDVRVIAATNRNLTRMVGEGRFLEDLYYRLNVIPLHLAPLRERPEDIPVLAEYFVRKHAQRVGKPLDGIQNAVRDVLLRYSWPGNVRELENTIERAVVLSTGSRIGEKDITTAGAAPAWEAAPLPSMNLHQNVEWAERETVRRALTAMSNVKKNAAELIGISQRALSYYLAKYDFD